MPSYHVRIVVQGQHHSRALDRLPEETQFTSVPVPGGNATLFPMTQPQPSCDVRTDK